LSSNPRCVEKLRAQKVAFEDLIIPDEIHDPLRWDDWIRAYRATAEFLDRKLAALGERQQASYGDVTGQLPLKLKFNVTLSGQGGPELARFLI
jgi:hypothetical protein